MTKGKQKTRVERPALFVGKGDSWVREPLWVRLGFRKKYPKVFYVCTNILLAEHPMGRGWGSRLGEGQLWVLLVVLPVPSELLTLHM